MMKVKFNHIKRWTSEQNTSFTYSMQKWLHQNSDKITVEGAPLKKHNWKCTIEDAPLKDSIIITIIIIINYYKQNTSPNLFEYRLLPY